MGYFCTLSRISKEAALGNNDLFVKLTIALCVQTVCRYAALINFFHMLSNPAFCRKWKETGIANRVVTTFVSLDFRDSSFDSSSSVQTH